jgi:hypothetical protein
MTIQNQRPGQGGDDEGGGQQNPKPGQGDKPGQGNPKPTQPTER